MDTNYEKELSNFESVWKRITGEKKKKPDIVIMPGKAKKPCRRYEVFGIVR